MISFGASLTNLRQESKGSYRFNLVKVVSKHSLEHFFLKVNKIIHPPEWVWGGQFLHKGRGGNKLALISSTYFPRPVVNPNTTLVVI